MNNWNNQFAAVQARVRRWREPGRSKVVHPDHGETIVPHGSPLSAVMCAADVWGVPWYSVIDAKVLAVPADTMREDGK